MNNYVGLTKKIKVPSFTRRKHITDIGGCGMPIFGGTVVQIESIQYRIQLDVQRTVMTRKYGMNIPQDINDALTRKDLELKKRGE